MANLILPNGQTIQTDNPAEIAEFMARGAQDQSAAVAASPGQTIQQIASERGQAWNSQGGQGYLDAMRGGFNDPTSDPRNPQAFSAAARQQYNNGLLAPTPSGGGGLLGGGGNGGGSNGGFPASTIPIFSNVGGMSQQPSMQPSMPMPSMVPVTRTGVLRVQIGCLPCLDTTSTGSPARRGAMS